MKRVINITNGDCFNSQLARSVAEPCVPFREVMMDGEAVAKVYSAEFIDVRAAALGVTRDEYAEKMLSVRLSDYDEIRLWFGEDTFCQMNLLTLLAYFEQQDYGGEVRLSLIDDATFDVIDSDIPVVLGVYTALYEALLVRKEEVCAQGVISRRAVELYYDYLSPEGKLATLIKNSPEDESGLLMTLLNATAQYGLSDIQCQRLIEQYKK